MKGWGGEPRSAGPTPELTLLVPGMLGPWPPALGVEICRGLDTPGLGQLLARARIEPAASADGEPVGLEALVLAEIDPAHPEVLTSPAAPITLAGDGVGPRAAWVMRADPVHLRTDVGTAFLFDARHLALGPAESAALVTELNAHTAIDGYRLEAPCPERWYVRLPERPALVLHPPSAVARREIGPLLPAGADGGLWRRRLNELQMLLHVSPVNASREARGALPVNSLWLWGLGELSAGPSRARFDTLWSDDPLAGGLAALHWVSVRPRPEGLTAFLCLAREAPGARHLVVLPECHAAVLSNDVAEWREGIDSIEQGWLAPACELLRSGGLRRLELRTALRPGGVGAVCTRASLRRWWRRTRRLAELLARSDLGWAESAG